ncbi:MAG TPA: right-handed parallel beta-helix repeat-containing protein [Thermoanaerobaculia bacterium]|jgi:hypothetical protein|nr:right-handed parallel beta-helix repeat-containing protein [Thermoanaerobaculia bacterium]
MHRTLLFLLAVVSFPVSAVSRTTYILPPLAIVDAGETTTFRTYAANNDPLEVENVRVRYEIEGDATIEKIEPKSIGWTCAIEGKTAECTQQYVLSGEQGLEVTVRGGAANGASATLKMSATSPRPAPPEYDVSRATVQNHHALIVDTTADSGPGSLRAAFEAANALDVPAKIVFNLPPPVPAEGWFTIIPESPLPPITTQRIFIDGKSQTRFTGDTNTRGPEIAIDGHLAHYGLEVHSPCATRIEGLVLGNFDANSALWFTKTGVCATYAYPVDLRSVTDNYLGTDPTGTTAWPNMRGLRVDFGSGLVRNNVISGNSYSGMWVWVTAPQPEALTIENNRIGTAADGATPLPNGTTGILFGGRVSADVRGNVIANHPGMGIALVRGDSYVEIRQNSIRDNGGIGIDWGIDGVSSTTDADSTIDPNAPTLLASRYDATLNRTYFTVFAQVEYLPRPAGSAFHLDFYANRGSDGDGETWLGSVGGGGGGPNGGQPYEAWVGGDHRGKWVNATLTRSPVYFAKPPEISAEAAGWDDASTSELSNAILVN